MVLPISLCFFTSTKGHFGHKDVYLTTLRHLDRQIPLTLFGSKIAHIKVTPGEENIAANMQSELQSRGFKVLTTVADWSRGQSHQAAYMADVVKMSKEDSVYHQPYVLWYEDDQTITPHQCTASDLLLRSCRMLSLDNELVSVRLLRATDLSSSPMIGSPTDAPNTEYFYSPHVNFQPLLLRSRDFYLAARFVEENPKASATVQCEMLWRYILEPFSRSEKRHIVYFPAYAETIHLGTPDYLRLKSELNL